MPILTTLTSQTDPEALQQQAQKFFLETAVNSYLDLLKV